MGKKDKQAEEDSKELEKLLKKDPPKMKEKDVDKIVKTFQKNLNKA